MQHKVTVIIANHNYGEFLDEAIQSALSQTYPDVKVAVMDDASTDNSMTVLRKYGKNKRVSFQYNKEKKGPSLSRNALIYKHWDETDYFAILDSDDVMQENKVERMMRVMGANKSVGVTYADYHILNSSTGIAIKEFKKNYDRELLLNDCIVHSGSIISKEALNATKLDDETFYDPALPVSEDWDLWLRISSQFAIIHIPEFLTTVRVTGKNTSFSVKREIWQRCWGLIHQRKQDGYYR